MFGNVKMAWSPKTTANKICEMSGLSMYLEISSGTTRKENKKYPSKKKNLCFLMTPYKDIKTGIVAMSTSASIIINCIK